MTRRRTFSDRVVELLPWALAVLFGAVAIHLLTILATPAFAPHSVYRRLARPLPPGEIIRFGRAAPGGPDPAYADPFAAIALCRFDLTQGPLRLRARADGDHPLSVSVRLADGTVIYSAGDRQTPGGRFNLLVMTEKQAEAREQALEAAEEESDAKREGEDELRLVSPGKAGFAVARALSLREGGFGEAASQLANVECAVEKPVP